MVIQGVFVDNSCNPFTHYIHPFMYSIQSIYFHSMVSAIPFTIIHLLDTFSVQIYRVYEDGEKQTIRQDESRSRDKAEERRPVQGKNVTLCCTLSLW